MTLGTALRLGRVSNLPTVWTDVLAGVALSGAMLRPAAIVVIACAVSLMYVGGMVLNDAFDADFDAKERPERPIPSGEIEQGTAFMLGFGLLAAGQLVLVVRALLADTGFMTAFAGMILAFLIVAYDRSHKENRYAPLLMGLCRAMVYVLAGVSGEMAADGDVFLGAGLLLVYLMGLTGVARQEHLGKMESMLPLILLAAPLAWVPALGHPAGIGVFALFACWTAWNAMKLARPAAERSANLGEDADLVDAVLRGSKDEDVRKLSTRPPPPADSLPPARSLPGLDSLPPDSLAPAKNTAVRDPEIGRAVGRLIAGIALVDGVFVAGTGAASLAALCVGCFALTLLLQRVVPGT